MNRPTHLIQLPGKGPLVALIEALASEGWCNQDVRNFLRTRGWRTCDGLGDAARMAARDFGGALEEQRGADVIERVIEIITGDEGWSLFIEKCAVRPRVAAIH